jgi:hypothetical protein
MDVDDGRLGEPRAVRGVENELYSLRVIGDTLLAVGYGTLIAFDMPTRTGRNACGRWRK